MCIDSSVPVPVSARHFGTGAELSGHFGTSMVPKCLGSEVSLVRSVLTPKSSLVNEIACKFLGPDLFGQNDLSSDRPARPFQNNGPSHTKAPGIARKTFCLLAFAVNTLCDPFADTVTGPLEEPQNISHMFFSSAFSAIAVCLQTKQQNRYD